MTNPPFPQWTDQSQDAQFVLPGTFAAKSSRLETTVRRRNALEYGVGLFCIAAFGWVAWLTASAGALLMSAGWIVLIIGVIVVLANLTRIASNLERRPELDCRSHLRAQMVRQKQALNSVTSWYLAPLVPGMVLVLGATAAQVAGEIGWLKALAGTAPSAMFVGLVFGAVRWLNHRAARKLAAEINRLDALE